MPVRRTTIGCLICRFRGKRCYPTSTPSVPGSQCTDCAKYNIRCWGSGLDRESWMRKGHPQFDRFMNLLCIWRADTRNRAKLPFDPAEIIQHLAALLVSQTSDAPNIMATPHTAHHPLAIQPSTNDALIAEFSPLSPQQLSFSNLIPNTPTPQDVISATHTRSSYADRTLNSPLYISPSVSPNRHDAATYHFSSPRILQHSPLHESRPTSRLPSPLLQQATYDNYHKPHFDESNAGDTHYDQRPPSTFPQYDPDLFWQEALIDDRNLSVASLPSNFLPATLTSQWNSTPPTYTRLDYANAMLDPALLAPSLAFSTSDDTIAHLPTSSQNFPDPYRLSLTSPALQAYIQELPYPLQPYSPSVNFATSSTINHSILTSNYGLDPPIPVLQHPPCQASDQAPLIRCNDALDAGDSMHVQEDLFKLGFDTLCETSINAPILTFSRAQTPGPVSREESRLRVDVNYLMPWVYRSEPSSSDTDSSSSTSVWSSSPSISPSMDVFSSLPTSPVLPYDDVECDVDAVAMALEGFDVPELERWWH